MWNKSWRVKERDDKDTFDPSDLFPAGKGTQYCVTQPGVK
jgi:hypothetical protein